MRKASRMIENQPLVSIVILCYHSERFIGPCLRSMSSLEYRPIEIIVADNASGDSSLRVAGETAHETGLEISLLALEANRGCAGGNNAGWRASHGEIVIFLNPDTEVTPTFVTELAASLLANPNAGIAGAKIYYPGTRMLQHAGGIIYPNAMTDHFGAKQEDRGEFDELREVSYVTGAGFAVRRCVLEQLGGFDEDYFPAYFEEADLCTRARRQGWPTLYAPSAVLYHHESVSLAADSPAFRRLYARMRIRYCLKNFTLLEWALKFIPFEYRWMRYEPRAKGFRREQFRAYADGALWWIGKSLARLLSAVLAPLKK